MGCGHFGQSGFSSLSYTPSKDGLKIKTVDINVCEISMGVLTEIAIYAAVCI